MRKDITGIELFGVAKNMTLRYLTYMFLILALVSGCKKETQ